MFLDVFHAFCIIKQQLGNRLLVSFKHWTGTWEIMSLSPFPPIIYWDSLGKLLHVLVPEFPLLCVADNADFHFKSEIQDT